MIPFSLKVSYNRGQYIATVGCNGIKGPANVEKFECDGKMVLVKEYFETKLKMKLQYPYLPCVWVGSREKKKPGPNGSKFSYLDGTNILSIFQTPSP